MSTIHKDLGLLLSEDLSWDRHYKFIVSRAYKTLGVIHHTFISKQSPATLTKLYISLVRLFYCTQQWQLHLIKDILSLEQIQCRATKYILNDYTICYRAWLIKLKLLPLIYLFELQDILFAVKSIKNSSFPLLTMSSSVLPIPDLVLQGWRKHFDFGQAKYNLKLATMIFQKLTCKACWILGGLWGHALKFKIACS